MPIYWNSDADRLPLPKRLHCVHTCACGAVLVCGDPDKCPVAQSAWTCDACDLDSFDQWIATVQR